MKKHRLMNHQKYFRTLCFGLSFLTAACTNESPLNTEPAEGPKTSISIQATVDTKAANEPETAADNGTITRAGGDKQVPAGYRLRCKLEVYSKTTDLRVAQAQLFIDDNSGLTGAITFPDVHLPPNDTYKAICWADYIAAGTETELIYNTSKGLSDIHLNRNNRHRSCGNRRQRSGYRRCLCRTIRNFHHRSKRCCQGRG